MKKAIVVLLFLSFQVISQNITIKGKAHSSYIGKEVVLQDMTDYISYTRTKESTDTIDKDGYFELKYQSHITKPLFISIGNVTGKLYLQPDFVYGIYFPEKDSLLDYRGDVEVPVDITLYTRDSTELNSLIIDFNLMYNQLFESATKQYLSPAIVHKKLDSLHIMAKDKYKKLDKGYFRNYVEYTIANLNSNASRNQKYLLARYINQKPILYDNYEYMEFFNSIFKDYLKVFATSRSGGNVYNSINAFSDYDDLMKQFKDDKQITNDTIRELVVLKGLYEFYYNPDFNKQHVLSMIEQLRDETKIKRHQAIANHILQGIYQLQPGAKAPNFNAEEKTGKIVSLSDYTGKYIYLNFFNTSSETSLREMPKIADLKKKYSDKVVFISVCTDDSSKTWKQYLKSNPKFDWLILFNNSTIKGTSAKDVYNIKGVPAFFFISPQGQLVQSPAHAPSEGIEYKFKALFRPSRKNTIPGIR